MIFSGFIASFADILLEYTTIIASWTKMIDDPASFAKSWKNKPITAAYLRYTTVAKLCCFHFHYVVLYWFTVFLEYCTQKNAKILLPVGSILHYCWVLMSFSQVLMSLIANTKDTDKFFPQNLDTIAQMYPTSDVDKSVSKKNKDYIYATVIFRLAEDILTQLSNLFVDPKK